MPFTVKCKNCSKILYRGEIIALEEILSKYPTDGRDYFCPNCGRKLESDIDRVEINFSITTLKKGVQKV